MNLFLDANAYLTFYRLSKEDLEELRKLIVEVKQGETTLLLRRPWSRLSDRMLSWYIWLFAVSAIVSVFGLVTGPARVPRPSPSA